MKSYSSPTPSASFGFAAIAMTALTIGALVVAPARLVPSDSPPTLVASAQAARPAPTEVTIEPSRIEVTAVREASTTTVLGRNAQLKRKQPV